MAVNKHRGEVEFAVGERTIKLVPSFGVLVTIEERIGEGIGAIFERARTKGIGVRDVSAILELAGKVKRADIGPMIEAHGLFAFAGPVVEFLVNAITGGAAASDAAENPPSDETATS